MIEVRLQRRCSDRLRWDALPSKQALDWHQMLGRAVRQCVRWARAINLEPNLPAESLYPELSDIEAGTA